MGPFYRPSPATGRWSYTISATDSRPEDRGALVSLMILPALSGLPKSTGCLDRLGRLIILKTIRDPIKEITPDEALNRNAILVRRILDP